MNTGLNMAQEVAALKGVPAPGSLPSSHVGTLRRLIFFGYDLSARSVVIGPAPLRNTVEART